MTRRSSLRRLLSTLAAGLLVASSMPPWGWWPLSFVGLAWFTTIENRDQSSRQRFTNGLVFGLGWFLPALAWMWFLTAPGYLIAALVFAVLHGVASTIVGGVDRSRRLIAAPAAHTLVEILRLSFPFGGVPLATLAIAQVSGPLAATARLGGVIALTWITWQIAAWASTSVRREARRRWLVPVTVVVVVVAGTTVAAGRDTGTTVRIAAVQGGGPQGTRAVDTDPRDVVERHLAATATIEGPVDLVVWPENVVDVPNFATSPEIDEIALESRRLGAPFVVGITEDVDSESFTNAQVVVDASDRVLDRYDKVRRVPFGEYMPLRGLLAALGAPVDLVPRDAVAGDGPAVLRVPFARGTNATGSSLSLAVVISWEVFFGGRAREGVRRGGGIVLNPTNGSSYTWTILQTQQIASSRLRALETGRWVVQVAPTGFSAFVSPDGEVFERTAVSERAVIERDVPVRTGTTPYSRLGDGPWIAAVGIVSVFGLSRRRVRSRS